MRAEVIEIFHLWLSLVCKPQTLCPAEWPLQPDLELGSLSPQWALDPRHGPARHGTPARKRRLFSSPCAVCLPASGFSLKMEWPCPQLCKAGLALLYCPQESKSSGPASTWTITRPTPLPPSWLLRHPTSSRSRTLHHASLASWALLSPAPTQSGCF